MLSPSRRALLACCTVHNQADAPQPADESQSKVKPYLSASLVVVDEVGYLPVNANEAYLLFQFVSSRYERAPTIITSNKSFIDWQELFGDQIIASAILTGCSIAGSHIKGQPSRLKGKEFVQQLQQNYGGDATLTAPVDEIKTGVVHFYSAQIGTFLVDIYRCLLSR